MALSRLLQPKLNVPISRLSFSTVTPRFFNSKRCNGDSGKPSPSKEEAAAEGTGITPLEHSVKESLEEKKGFFSKATSVLGLVARYVGSTKPERPPIQFSENKGHQTASKVENEGRKAEAALSDDHNVKCEVVERPLQSDSPKVIRLKSASSGEIDKDNQTKTTAENVGRKAEKALSDYQNVSCDGVKRSLQSDCSPEALGLESASDGSALKIDKPTKPKRLSVQFSEHKDKQAKTTAENEGRKDEATLSDYQNESYETLERSLQSDTSPNVLGLKSASDVSAWETDEPSGYCSSTNLIEDSPLNANLQRSDDNAVLNLLDFLDLNPSIEDKKISNSDSKNIELKDLKICFTVPTISEDQRQRRNAHLARTESVENRVLVSFLDSRTPKNIIRKFFSDCGEILKFEVPTDQGPLFNAAYINFKTNEGFENALKKSGSLINGTIIVEPATVREEKTVKISIPGLLGDPDIPSAVIKNPTRTIKIEKLTREMSSHHIAEALAFCKSNISGYTLGSSYSVAYVEFESEIGKERALAKQSINVLGRQLVMLRIDCPRTTVVRISTTDNLNVKETTSICKSLGNVNIVKHRCASAMDVHYKLAEWPNMVKILNGLNGRMVEGKQRLQAESAPVFPPEVLLALWHHPEERKCLEATAQALLRKLIISDTSELASLEKDFFCKI